MLKVYAKNFLLKETVSVTELKTLEILLIPNIYIQNNPKFWKFILNHLLKIYVLLCTYKSCSAVYHE